MANAIKPKSTSTVSKVAASGDLLVGELGANIADGVLFLKKSDNSIAVFKTTNETITLSGDVSGSGTSGITTTLSTVTIGKGGTGQTTAQSAINALTGTQSAGKYLRSDGTNATLSSIQAADVPTLNQNTSGSSGSCTGNAATATSATSATTATTATNIAGGGAGQIPYNTGSGATSFLAAGTAGQVLQSNATSAPTWANLGMPTGALMPYAGASAPTGYLLCDGSSVSSSTYLALHAVISNTYGGTAYTGAAGLSFNLPDLKGRMPIGSMGTGSGLTARVTGTKYGTESHTVSSSNISQFTTGNMNANVNHSHAPSGGSLFWVYNAAGANSVPNTAPQVFKISADSSTATTASTNLEHQHTVGSASPTAINHLPPTIGLNYIIKT